MYISAKEITFPFTVTGVIKVCSTIERDLNNSVKFEPVNILPPPPPRSIPKELAKPKAPPNPPPDFSSSKAKDKVAV
ncbi:hypothetical protein D3C84_1016670 [compost metagenome]